MQLLISDANILIDMEAGQLLPLFFSLPYGFGMPDSVYAEEIEPGTPGLDGLGLRLLEVRGDWVSYAFGLTEKYTEKFKGQKGEAPNHNDYLALAAAKQEQGRLLTGDGNLRIVAQSESVRCHGTVWLLEEMLKARLIAVDACESAVARMKDSGRRLPWSEIADRMDRYRNPSFFCKDNG